MNNIKSIIRAVLLAGFLCISSLVLAQNSITVTGTVKDTGGEPIIGAAVMVEGTSNGALTDIDGKYTISVSQKSGAKTKLVYSSISYISQTVELNGRSIIDIVLEDDLEQLDEVVVVGYGAMKKSDLTGSVTSVSIDETKALQSGSIDQLLQGQAAGVHVVSNSSAPDAGVSVIIRGASSFNSNSQPLYVVDGVLMNTSGSMSVGSHAGDDAGITEDNNGLIGISPQDIASIEILKDASATAIYGSQGANGVILITTKSATMEKPVITFSSGVTISNIRKKFDLLTPTDYLYFLDLKGEPHTSTHYKAFTSEVESGQYSPIDWQDYTTRTGISQRYYLTVAGRPKNANYRLSIGYNDNQGIIKQTGYENLTMRLNLDKTIKNFSIGTKSSISYMKSEMTQGIGGTASQTPATSMIMSMLLTRPLQTNLDYDPEGYEIDSDYAASGPDRWMTDYQSERSEIRINPSLYAQYKIRPWLTFKSTIGGDFRSSERLNFKSKRINTRATGSTGAVAQMIRLNWNWDNLLMVNKKFGKHQVNGTLGQSASAVIGKTETVEGTNVLQWKAMVSSLNSAPFNWLTYSESYSQLMSFFARAMYNYDERYILTATYRFDGSSKFAGANKWAQFPSFAFAWRINNEPWFNIPCVSSAKLRLGWGMVGNQGVPSYQTIYRYSTGTMATHDNPSHLQLYTTSLNLPSYDLKWETTTQYNVGLDLGFFKGRLTLAADAYYKVTDDLLQTKTLPASSGVTNPYVNMGSIENRGFEITLTSVPVHTKNFEWTLGGNFSLNRNKILSIDPSGLNTSEMYLHVGEGIQTVDYFTGSKLSADAYCKDYINIFIAGQPMGVFYGMPTNGLVPVGEQGIPLSDGKFRGAGSINYIDTNNDGMISALDRVIIGDPNPDFTYGFNTSLTYKKVTLRANFVGSYGNDIFNQQGAVLTDVSTRTQNRLKAAVYDAWTVENQNAKYPAISAYALTDVNWCTDRFVEDGSYLRLSTMSLTYALPIKNKNSVVKFVSLGVTANNLFVWTKYSGYDPDVNVYGTVTKYGVDMGSYPSSREYLLDLKLSF